MRQAILLWLSIVSFAVATSTSAQPTSKAAMVADNVVLAKAAGHLLEARLLAKEQLAPGEIRSRVPLVRYRDGLAEIEVRLDVLTPALLEQIREIGMRVEYASFRWARIDGLLDLALLEELASIPEVSTIHPDYGYITWIGDTTSQGDTSIRTELARSTYGIDGSGVTVGVISDSFNNTLGGSASGGACTCDAPGSVCANVVTGMANQTSLDLPASVALLDDGPGGGTDEGAAMGEIVHDLAPGAAVSFHSGSNGIADFADAITELSNCGADVIVADVQYFAEPIFQDGIVAQAVEEAVGADVVYVSSAGDTATFGIDDDFVDADPTDDEDFPPTGVDFHDFLAGGAQSFARITIPASTDPLCGPSEPDRCCGIVAVLQWTEPFDGGIEGGGSGLGPGAFDDLDLYLYDSPDPAGSILASSLGLQGCSVGMSPAGDPLEVLSLSNTTGSALDAYLAIENVCGDQDQRLRVATFPLGPCGLTTSGYDFEDGESGESAIFVDAQIYGGPAAAGAIAVAAADYREIDSGGIFQGDPLVIDVQPLSSLGGDLPFFFDGAGSPAGPETRFKPDLTAPDGTNNTFLGTDVEPDGFPNFFGTSASAPHAAAVVALMQELGNLSPSGLEQVLEQGAIDLEAPDDDPLAGSGLIDAVVSVATTAPTAAGCVIDDLVLVGKPNTGLQTFRACVSLTVGGGDFSEVTGIADLIVFTDGFESGDSSAWGPPP